jgi:SAM-dependent methyltransferase
MWDGNYAKGANFSSSVSELYAGLRFRFFQRFLHGRILEIGAGLGGFSTMAGATDVLDVSAVALENIRRLSPQASTHQFERLPLPFADGTFDAVVLNDVWHHIKESQDLAAYARELHRILKPSGVVVISDRRPTALNKVLLALNDVARSAMLKLRPQTQTLGAEIELATTADDFAHLTTLFHVEDHRKWRSLIAFTYTALLFAASTITNRPLGKGAVRPIAWLEETGVGPHLDFMQVLRKR